MHISSMFQSLIVFGSIRNIRASFIPGTKSLGKLTNNHPQGRTTTWMTMTRTMSMSMNTKNLIIVRHGQAQHNPRAEVAKEKGCTMEEFISLMREDDALDARLTEIGRQQALDAARVLQAQQDDVSPIQLVTSSTLSRAIETADCIFPCSITTTTTTTTSSTSSRHPKRVCNELFREVNGDMLNAKRRTRTELIESFPDWNFDEVIDEEDALWTPDMETFEAAAERGYLGLKWIMDQEEETILLVSHGGILKYMMDLHPLIVLNDGRANPGGKPVNCRFDNCEIRRYILGWVHEEGVESTKGPSISLTQVS